MSHFYFTKYIFYYLETLDCEYRRPPPDKFLNGFFNLFFISFFFNIFLNIFINDRSFRFVSFANKLRKDDKDLLLLSQ